jgi:hypothetical protein
LCGAVLWVQSGHRVRWGDVKHQFAGAPTAASNSVWRDGEIDPDDIEQGALGDCCAPRARHPRATLACCLLSNSHVLPKAQFFFATAPPPTLPWRRTRRKHAALRSRSMAMPPVVAPARPCLTALRPVAGGCAIRYGCARCALRRLPGGRGRDRHAQRRLPGASCFCFVQNTGSHWCAQNARAAVQPS